MIDRIDSAYRAAAHAVDLIVHNAASVNPWWLAAGLAAHLVAQTVRLRGWFNILRAAYPEDRELRNRDVVAAYFAGAGVNSVVPARGGDVLKLYMIHRRIEGSRYTTLAATLVPETLFESIAGAALVIWALAQGFLPVPLSANELPSLDVSLIIAHPIISSVVAAVLAGTTWAIIYWLQHRGRNVVGRLRRGFAILRQPRAFITGVASWQLLGRIIRLGSMACFMAAFALPVTFASVLLVMAASGGGRIIPIAPASAGLRLAMLSYGFVEITGKQVDIASITAFTFGVGAVMLVSGVIIASIIIAHTFGTLDPRRAVAAARAALEARPLRRAEEHGPA
jgi:uncharacterized membrane protein YbhN (UPF0104 family)